MTDLDGYGYRLGRTVWHDEASREHPAAHHRLRSVEWPLAAGAQVLDQGQLGSCTANALCQALNTQHGLAQRQLRGQGSILAELDARGIYSDATKLDPYPGEWPPEDTGSSGLAVCKVAKSRGLIRRYRHAFSLEATLRALAGSPVIIGIGWRESMFTPVPAGGLPAVLTVVGPVVGGHEVCLDALDVDRQMVRVLNSWSDLWGWQGRAWLSWANLGALLHDNGDCTVPVP
jgi:hypothetical protein